LVDHGEEIRRGRQFINGPMSKKKDKLAREIMKGLEKIGRKASANQLLTFVRKNENFEVEGDKSIHWTSDRGAPKTTTFKAFENRISELRHPS
jgi:hypothetical protein